MEFQAGGLRADGVRYDSPMAVQNRWIVVAAGLVLGALIVMKPSRGAAAESPAQAQPSKQQATEAVPPEDSAPPFGARPATAKLPYDTEYPALHYTRAAANNAIARLQSRLDRGEVKLQFRPGRGYLDSLLAALGIDPSSQSLVYSKTSLQVGSIQAATPRAIYFNDDTYVAWVQGSDQMELGAMDTDLGQVFYTFRNRAGDTARFQRENANCLSCHDTYSLSGGGVPRFLLMSAYVDVHGEQLTHEGSILVTDQTQMKYRWGGWYVTGQHGAQVHLGNIQVHNVQELVQLEEVRRGNLDTLDGLFDTHPYLTDKSDIVALIVLLHQVTVQEFITRVNFEVRQAFSTASGTAAVGATKGGVPTLSAKTVTALEADMDDLVNAMLFVDAAGYSGKITGNSGFDRWFEARGIHDSHGRSLRDLDLTSRLLKYPLSYLIYSESFDALPAYAKNYVYGRLAAVLSGKDQSKPYAHLSAGDRKAMLEILTATKPEFAAAMSSKETAP